MSIPPLQSLYPSSTRPGSGAARRNGGSSFGGMLDAYGAGLGGEAGKASVAAELLQIEMMQSTLALGGGEASAQPTGVQALEALLAGIADNGGVTPRSGGTETATGGAETAAAPESSAAAAPDFPSAGQQGPGIGVGEITRTASSFLGIPYRFGGEGASGIDCSSLVQQVFRDNHVFLPRTAREQSQMGVSVDPAHLKEGDLLFFHTYAGYPSHVGIYIGNGKMIHASSAKGEVTISDINTPYYRAHFLGAKRVA